MNLPSLAILKYLGERNTLNTLDAITGIDIEAAFNKNEKEKFYYNRFRAGKILNSLGITVIDKVKAILTNEYFSFENYTAFGNTQYDISEYDELRILNQFYQSNQNVE